MGNTKRMARHTYGCRAIQRMIEHCNPEQLRPMLAEISEELKELSEDEYGNYVIQTMAERADTPQARTRPAQAVSPERTPLRRDATAMRQQGPAPGGLTVVPCQ